MTDEFVVRQHSEFAVHTLNEEGFKHANDIKRAFDELLSFLEIICVSGHQMEIVKTKLEEACLFAKKAMAIDLTNQKPDFEKTDFSE